MIYVAIVKDKYNKNAQWEVMKKDYYKTKKGFKTDLYGNGYIIKNSYIYTEEEWNDNQKMEEICEKLESKKNIKRIRSKVRRDTNKILNKIYER